MSEIIFGPKNIDDHLDWFPDGQKVPTQIKTVIEDKQIKVTMTMWIPLPRIKTGHEHFFSVLREVTDELERG